MASQSSYIYTATAVVVLTSVVFVLRRKQNSNKQRLAAKSHSWATLPPEQLPQHTGRHSPRAGHNNYSQHAQTMSQAYDIFCQTMTKLRHVKGLLFPFTLQALLPGWMNKGDPNVLGLENCKEPLMILNCSVSWTKMGDDEFVRSTVRAMFEQIDAAAVAIKTNHPYRFMNYCMEWQRPYDGCGKENLKHLRDASRKYDPDGLFQSGCAGGFKLYIGSQ